MPPGADGPGLTLKVLARVTGLGVLGYSNGLFNTGSTRPLFGWTIIGGRLVGTVVLGIGEVAGGFQSRFKASELEKGE